MNDCDSQKIPPIWKNIVLILSLYIKCYRINICIVYKQGMEKISIVFNNFSTGNMTSTFSLTFTQRSLMEHNMSALPNI